MNRIKLLLSEEKFASLSSNEVVYASEEEEFFYSGTDEPVPFGEPVGIDVPIYGFEYLQHEESVKGDDNSRDAEKWRYNANQEFEALLNDWIQPSEIKLVLFKDIYWKPNYENKTNK